MKQCILIFVWIIWYIHVFTSMHILSIRLYIYIISTYKQRNTHTDTQYLYIHIIEKCTDAKWEVWFTHARCPTHMIRTFICAHALAYSISINIFHNKPIFRFSDSRKHKHTWIICIQCDFLCLVLTWNIKKEKKIFF